jgi:hypothetical protein
MIHARILPRGISNILLKERKEHFNHWNEVMDDDWENVARKFNDERLKSVRRYNPELNEEDLVKFEEDVRQHPVSPKDLKECNPDCRSEWRFPDLRRFVEACKRVEESILIHSSGCRCRKCDPVEFERMNSFRKQDKPMVLFTEPLES